MNNFEKLKKRHLTQKTLKSVFVLLLIFPIAMMGIKAPKYKPPGKSSNYIISAKPYKLIPPEKIEATVIVNEWDDRYYPCDKIPVPQRSIVNSIRYPKAINNPQLYGVAVIHALVNEYGEVEKCVVAREPIYALLTERFVAAVENTIFTPALRDGEPVPVWIGIPVSFKVKKHIVV